MADADTARRLALALPEATEQEHHGFPSFRVGGKIFATLPEPGQLNVLLREDAVREAIAIYPAACAEQWWGATLTAVRVALAAIDDDALGELLAAAWTRRAPRRLVAAREAGDA